MVKTSMGSDEKVPHRPNRGRVGSLKPSILVGIKRHTCDLADGQPKGVDFLKARVGALERKNFFQSNSEWSFCATVTLKKVH